MKEENKEYFEEEELTIKERGKFILITLSLTVIPFLFGLIVGLVIGA